MPRRVIDTEAVVRRDPAVAWEVVDGEAVLYHERHGSVCLLDAIALAIWEALDGRRSLGALAGDLADRFAADAGQVERDVVAAVTRYAEQGLLDDVPPRPEVIVDLQLVTPEAEPPPSGGPRYRRVPPDR